MQRLSPTRFCLVRQSCDQIDAYFFNPRAMQPDYLSLTLRPRVQSPNRPGLTIDKRLNTQTDSVHAVPLKRLKRLRIQLAGSTLDGDLCIARYVELSSQNRKYVANLITSQQARRSPAKVNRIRRASKNRIHVLSVLPCLVNLLTKPFDIGLQVLHPKGV
jgi:hypothetical protein